jgi:DNA-binding FadR family transcriptional regulator
MPVSAALPQAIRRSLVESTIDLIRTQMESGAWKVGERIPKESELAEMLGVSRNTVREAIRVLSHANMLEVRQGDGTYVRSSVDAAEIMRRVSRASLRDHFELRAILETEAARLAATRRTDEDLEQLHRLLKGRNAQRKGPSKIYVEMDLAFHLAVTQAAHNAALDELYRYFLDAAPSKMRALLEQRTIPDPDAAAHAKIVTATEDRNPDQAAKAARDVVMPAVEWLTALISE